MASYLSMYRLRQIEAIHPAANFEASDVQRAFRILATRNHIGKITVELKRCLNHRCPVQIQKSLKFNPESSYLIVGGYGGLGRRIATPFGYDVRRLDRGTSTQSRRDLESSAWRRGVTAKRSQAVCDITIEATSNGAGPRAVACAINYVNPVCYFDGILDREMGCQISLF